MVNTTESGLSHLPLFSFQVLQTVAYALFPKPHRCRLISTSVVLQKEKLINSRDRIQYRGNHAKYTCLCYCKWWFLLSKLSVKVLDHQSDSLLLSKLRICIQTTSKEKYTFKRLHDVTLFYKVHISSKEAQISLVNIVVCPVGLLCRYFLRKTKICP